MTTRRCLGCRWGRPFGRAAATVVGAEDPGLDGDLPVLVPWDLDLPGDRPPTVIRRLSGLSGGAITELLDRMEELGLVARAFGSSGRPPRGRSPVRLRVAQEAERPQRPGARDVSDPCVPRNPAASGRPVGPGSARLLPLARARDRMRGLSDRSCAWRKGMPGICSGRTRGATSGCSTGWARILGLRGRSSASSARHASS